MPSAAATPPRFSTLVLLSWIAILALNMFLPSLPNMAAAFRADYALVNLSVAGFLAVTAVMQLIVGPLSDRIGRRPVLLMALAIFTLASMGCVVASDIWSFLAFRVLQSPIIAGWVLALAVIRDTSPEEEAASRIGYVSMAMAIAPMLGPMLGGVLDELFGWRASFVLYAGAGLALLCLAWVDLGETNTNPSATFSAQFQTYPELVRSRRYWGYVVCMIFATGSFYCFLAGAPLVSKTVLSLSTASLGIGMGMTPAGFMLGSFVTGRYAQHRRLTVTIMSGRIVACTGLGAGLFLFLLGVVHPVTLFGAAFLMGLGNGLTLPSCHAGVLSVRPGLSGSASGLAGALTVAVGAVLSLMTGIAVAGSNGHYTLLAIILACSAVGIAAVAYVMRVDRREGL